MLIIFLTIAVSGAFHLSGPQEVERTAGDTMSISFRYNHFYENHVKYWCRGYYWNYCNVLRRSDERNPPDGRVKVSDNKGSHTFTVTMTDLKVEDGGWYWCAIERVSRHVKVSLELKVTVGRPVLHPALTTSAERSTAVPTTTLESTAPSTTAPLTSVTLFCSTARTTGTPFHWLVEPWFFLRWVLFAVLVLIPALLQVVLNRRSAVRKRMKKEMQHRRGDHQHLGLRVMDPMWVSSRQQQRVPSRKGVPSRKEVSSRKGVPFQKAVPSRKEVPSRKGVSPRQGVPSRKWVSPRQGVPSWKGVPLRQGVPSQKGVPSRQGVPSRKEVPSRQGVPSRKEVPTLYQHCKSLAVSAV